MILDLGILEYRDAYKIQKELVMRRRCGEIEDSMVITEHPSVFTIGRSGDRKNILVDDKYLEMRGIRLLTVDRGGDITFHGPGQIVVYLIIDLRQRGRDLHLYMRHLETAGMNFLKVYSVNGDRIPGRTGVWVDSKKIIFIGIAAADWITYHGLSVNINTDLGYFSMINPCGLKNIEVASLARILGRRIDMEEAKDKLISCLTKQFNLGAEYVEYRTTKLAEEAPSAR